jgi:hypothetical protein
VATDDPTPVMRAGDAGRLEVRGGMGGVVLVLPDGWSVDTEDLEATWGTVKNRYRAPAGPGRPTIHVTGSIGMGTFTTRGALFDE